MKDISALVGQGSKVMGRGANVLLSGGSTSSCDGGFLRDSRNAGHVCVCVCVWLLPAVWRHVCALGLRPSVLGDD